MGRLDGALDAFLDDINQRGLAGEVVVMTTSEFGRRTADEGKDGLDHGAASAALLFGPVGSGLHGEHPSLTKLDEDGNLRATVSVESYYAAVAEGWFGVPDGDLFAKAPETLEGVFT